MKTPLTDAAFKQRDGEGPFAHSTRQHATMAALETALRAIVENSFHGSSTGYQHVEPRRIEEARKLLDSENTPDQASA